MKVCAHCECERRAEEKRLRCPACQLAVCAECLAASTPQDCQTYLDGFLRYQDEAPEAIHSKALK